MVRAQDVRVDAQLVLRGESGRQFLFEKIKDLIT